MLFKDLIKTLRMTCLASQSELAKMLDIRQASISSYEMGKIKPNLITLKKVIDLANQKGIDVKYSDIRND